MYSAYRLFSSASLCFAVIFACGGYVLGANNDTYSSRAAELAAFQANDFEIKPNLTQQKVPVSFPSNFQNLSRKERVDVETKSYEPYFGKNAYHQIQLKDDTAERKLSECADFIACMQKYDGPEKVAEDEFLRAYNNWQNSKTVEEMQTNFKILPEKENLMYRAWGRSTVSPCVCAKGLMFADALLSEMDMLEKCNTWNLLSKENLEEFYNSVWQEVQGHLTKIENMLPSKQKQVGDSITYWHTLIGDL